MISSQTACLIYINVDQLERFSMKSDTNEQTLRHIGTLRCHWVIRDRRDNLELLGSRASGISEIVGAIEVVRALLYR